MARVEKTRYKRAMAQRLEIDTIHQKLISIDYTAKRVNYLINILSTLNSVEDRRVVMVGLNDTIERMIFQLEEVSKINERRVSRIVSNNFRNLHKNKPLNVNDR